MIINKINEIGVWLDQLEDEGVDVSLMRLLCIYGYLALSINSENIYVFVGSYYLGSAFTEGDGFGDSYYWFGDSYCSLYNYSYDGRFNTFGNYYHERN